MSHDRDTHSHVGDARDQHGAELRFALQRAVTLLYFEAGREAAADPEQADRLATAADGMVNVLARTARGGDRADSASC